MTVFVVMTVFNRLAATRRCIDDLLRQSHRPMKIIVCDGGSTDGTRSEIPAAYPDITLLSPEKELWWTEGMVLGVDRALAEARPGDFVLSMNNDVEIDDLDYLAHLVALSEAHGRALAGSFCWKDATETSFETCGGWARWTNGMLIHMDMVPIPGDPIELDFLVGRGLLVPVEVFERIGGFDAISFPQYWSDTDFTFRAKKAGFRLVASRSVALRHAEPTRTALRPALFLPHAEAWRRLTGMNSHLSLPQAWRFLRRHCPGTTRPAAVTVLLARALLFTVAQTFPFALIGKPVLWLIDQFWRRGKLSRMEAASASRG